MELPLLLMAGYNTSQEHNGSAKRREKIGYFNHNKALVGLEETNYSVMQKMIDSYSASKHISDIYVLGPKEEYEGIIEGCEFIDFNENIGLNLKRGLEFFKGEKIAISTSDTPYIETRHIDSYMSGIEEHLNKDIIIQLVDRAHIKEECWWKPSYYLKNENLDSIRILPGHLGVINTGEVPKFIYDGIDFIYDDLRLHSIKDKIWLSGKELYEKNALEDSLRLLGKPMMKFLMRSLQKKELEQLVETAIMTCHIQITDMHEFAEDVDTVEEATKAVDYLKRLNLSN